MRSVQPIGADGKSSKGFDCCSSAGRKSPPGKGVEQTLNVGASHEEEASRYGMLRTYPFPSFAQAIACFRLVVIPQRVPTKTAYNCHLAIVFSLPPVPSWATSATPSAAVWAKH